MRLCFMDRDVGCFKNIIVMRLFFQRYLYYAVSYFMAINSILHSECIRIGAFEILT